MFIARLLLKGSHLDGRALNNLPLCHFSCFTSTRADNSADGIKSTSVLSWMEKQGLGQTETLFTSASFERSSAVLNPKYSSQRRGRSSLPRRGSGEGSAPNALPVPTMDDLPSWSQRRLSITPTRDAYHIVYSGSGFLSPGPIRWGTSNWQTQKLWC